MPSRLRWPTPRRVSVWLIVVIGCALSVLVWQEAKRKETERIQVGFQRRAQAQASLARERLRLYEEMVYSLRDSFLGQSTVTREEFTTVSRELLRRHSGVQALQWLRIVPDGERPTVERVASGELGLPFTFKQPREDGTLGPARRADEYTVILFIEPLAGNLPALGYDVTTAPTAEFVAAARRDGKLAVSRAFRLSQSTSPNDEPGIVFILPVIMEPTATSPVLGFVQGVFRVQTMLSQAHLIGNNEELHTYYFDLDARGSTLLYANLGGREPMREGVIPALPMLRREQDFHDTIKIGDRRWRIVMQMNPAWAANQRTKQPLILLGAGLAITALLALFVNSLLQRTTRIETEVRLRTAELRESEARLQAILDHNPNAIFVKNLEGRYVLVNRQYERHWERPAADIIGRNDTELFSPEIAASYLRTDRQVLATGEAIRFELTVDLPGAKGPITGLVQKFPLRDADGRIYGLCGISTDITDSKLAEREKLSIERKLLEAQKLESLGVLAGGIAHDFNNILTSVLANASFANRLVGASSPASRNLEQIEHAARRAADLCQQMLAYAGKGQIVTDTIDLSEIVRGTASLLEVTINKNTRLDLRLARPLPAIVADATQLRQIVMNLVINAADAIGGAPGAVTVTTFHRHASTEFLQSALGHPDLPAGDYVGLAVTDTGCGMSAATLARIFEPFFTTKFSGRGLGLSAVLGIVQSHRGALFVESELGRGSTFRLLLPAVQAAARVPDEAPGERLARQQQLKGTALIVDDEPAVRVVAGEVLRVHGATCLLAATGQEALKLAVDHRAEIKLVLLDMTMPGLSGEETLQQLRAAGITCAVVIMSGYSEAESMRRTVNQGVDGFIQKPFEIESLVKAVKPHLS